MLARMRRAVAGFFRAEDIARAPVARRSTRSYAAAASSRLDSSWLTAEQPINRDMRASLPTLRARARDLHKNNAETATFLRQLADNVIGPSGFKLRMAVVNSNGQPDGPANAAIEESFRAWSKVGNCTACGTKSFYDLQRMAMICLARDGEFILRKVAGFPNRWAYALEIVPQQFLDHQLNQEASAGKNEIVMGVERNQWRRPVAYWFRAARRADAPAWLTDGQHRRVPADEIIHLWDETIPEAARGVSWLSPIAINLRHIGLFSEASLVNARASASKMGFIVRPNVDEDAETLADPDGADDAGATMDFEPGTLDRLRPGEDFKEFDPGFPNGETGPFIKTQHRIASAALGISYQQFTNDSSDGSYSNLRMGELTSGDYAAGRQTNIREHLLDVNFEAWLPMALLAGAFDIPFNPLNVNKYRAARWIGRGRRALDTYKEQRADIEGVSQAFTSRTQVAAERGDDFEEVVSDLQREAAILEKAGLKVQPLLPPSPTAMGEEPANEKEE